MTAIKDNIGRLRRIVDAAAGRDLTKSQAEDFSNTFKAVLSDLYVDGDDALIGRSVDDFRAALKAGIESGDLEDVVDGLEQWGRRNNWGRKSMGRLVPPEEGPLHGPGFGPMARFGQPDDEPGVVRALKSTDKLADRVGDRSGTGRLTMIRYLKGIITGDWRGVDVDELAIKTMSLSDAAGGYTVSDPLSARIIDRTRNAARVMQAGALTIPMEGRPSRWRGC
jgi:hypothetical protein